MAELVNKSLIGRLVTLVNTKIYQERVVEADKATRGQFSELLALHDKIVMRKADELKFLSNTDRDVE